MKRGLLTYLSFLLLFFPLVSFGQEGLIKLAEGVYGIKGHGAAMNTGFVVGDRGVFVFACDLPDYDRRMQFIRSVAGGKPIRAQEELKRGKVKPEYLEGKNVGMAMPAITFEEKITLDLGSHVVELLHLGKTHTPDTTIAWLPKEKILFAADLLFVELHPTADERSDVAHWQRVLKQLASWSPASVVPGHGAFAQGNGTKPLLDQHRYFDTMRNQIRSLRDAGKSVDEIKKGIRSELGEFAAWPRERAIPRTAEQVYRELPAK
jgi:glyoxylase-like metal-dependent hydrolase (beta-lactamase superfamily II)